MSVYAIKNSVGDNRGINQRPDVRIVQELLNGAIDSNPVLRAAHPTKLAVDGKCGRKTIAAIRAFQQSVLGWSGRSVDGRVDPNGKTWKALNQNITVIDMPPMVITGSVQGAVESSLDNSGDYQKFRQGNYRQSIGHGKDTDKDGKVDKTRSIAAIGCAMCTLTMAATRIGNRTRHWPRDLSPKQLDPLKANRILKKAGAFSGWLLIMKKAAKSLGMSYEEYGRNSNLGDEHLGKIDSHLSQGKPIAANVDYKKGSAGDHWILITSKNGDGTYSGLDPGSGKKVTLTSQDTDNVRYAATKNKKRGVLFGSPETGGSRSQQKYIVVRFALLDSLAGSSAVH